MAEGRSSANECSEMTARTLLKYVGGTLIAIFAITFVANLGAFKRYIKISTM